MEEIITYHVPEEELEFDYKLPPAPITQDLHGLIVAYFEYLEDQTNNENTYKNFLHAITTYLASI